MTFVTSKQVILVSSSQLFLGEWQKVERTFHPCDSATLRELICILATNVPSQNHEVGSFMANFLPEQASKVSVTRLVHCKLVKVFLLNGSIHDLAEMAVYIKCYIKYFTSVTEEDDPLLKAVSRLVLHADTVRKFEKQLMKPSSWCAGCDRNCGHHHRNRFLVQFRALIIRFFELNLG